MDEIKVLFETVLQGVLIAAITALGFYAKSFLTTQTEKLKDKIKSEKLRAALDEVNTAIAEAVAHTSQTYVDEIKKSGAFTQEYQQEAFAKARDTAIAALSPITREVLKDNYDEINTLIKTKIEAAVRSNKQ